MWGIMRPPEETESNGQQSEEKLIISITFFSSTMFKLWRRRTEYSIINFDSFKLNHFY
jgi:hypothetical protein